MCKIKVIIYVCRDAELSGLRAEIHEALGNRNMSDEQFKNGTLDELSNLKAALQLEREERIAEDDEIVQVRWPPCMYAFGDVSSLCRN